MEISKRKKENLMLSMVENVPFDGWTWNALYRGADDINFFSNQGNINQDQKDYLKGIFDYDIVNIIENFNIYLDNKMLSKYKKKSAINLRLPDKVKNLLLFRFNSSLKFRESIRLSIGFMSIPRNSKNSLSMLYRTCDLIWKTSGDNSTNFTFYSKRLVLSGLYISTLFFWVNDNSPDLIETEKFIDRRLNEISNIGRLKKKLNLENLGEIPNSNIPKFIMSKISKNLRNNKIFDLVKILKKI